MNRPARAAAPGRRRAAFDPLPFLARAGLIAALAGFGLARGAVPLMAAESAPVDAGTAVPEAPGPAQVPDKAPPIPPPAPTKATVKDSKAKGDNAPEGAQQPGGAQGEASPNVIGLPGQKGGAPVTIEADNGIEWDQNSQRYIARGNGKAVRGQDTVYGQVLTAYYRKTPSGGSDIWRVEAQDDVKIVSPSGVVLGDRAIYDVDHDIFVITGKHLSMTSPKLRVTARDSLEYYQKAQYAVARGDAVAVKEQKTIHGDVLEAHFKPDQKGDLQVTNVEAFKNVEIETPNAIAHGMYSDYNLESGIAILKGSVKITRGQDQLDGECAEVNTNTGVSRLFACGTAKAQVRGLLVPKQGQGEGKGKGQGSGDLFQGLTGIGKPAKAPAEPSAESTGR